MSSKSLDLGGVLRPRRRVSCLDWPGSTCNLTITGSEDEVVRLAVLHAIHAHGNEDTPELREEIHARMRDETLG